MRSGLPIGYIICQKYEYKPQIKQWVITIKNNGIYYQLNSFLIIAVLSLNLYDFYSQQQNEQGCENYFGSRLKERTKWMARQKLLG
jgi:hypothetical protein